MQAWTDNYTSKPGALRWLHIGQETPLASNAVSGVSSATGLGIPGRQRVSVKTGAFRFSGENLETIANDLPAGAVSELGVENGEGPVFLRRIDYMASDRAGDQVGDLQPG